MSDYSTLFSSIGGSTTSNSSSSDMLGINLTDYASIKNGSYRKLLSAHYAKEAENEGSSSSSTVKDSKETLTEIQSAAEDVKGSLSKLLDQGKNAIFKKKTDEKGNSYVDYDTDKAYKAVKDFVDNYNSLMDAASEADTLSILRATKSMVTYTKANEKALAAVGITVGSDNKLSIDEDEFKDASKARVQSLFQSTGSYAYQINAKATNINSYASVAAEKADSKKTSESSKSSTTSTSTSKDSSKTLAAIEQAAGDAQDKLSVLRKTGSKSLFNLTAAGNYDTNSIYDAVKAFLTDYNTLLDKTEDSNTSDITQARRTMLNYVSANKTALSNMGITIGSDGNLSIDADKFKASDMTKVKEMFQGNSSLGGQLEAQIAKIDTYADKQASKANTYSGNGTYSNNYTSGDWYNSIV